MQAEQADEVFEVIVHDDYDQVLSCLEPPIRAS
jgi:hypothetical protein